MSVGKRLRHFNRGASNFGESGGYGHDVKAYGDTDGEYVFWDASTGILTLTNTKAGGDSPKAMLIDVDVLAGSPYRQGGLQVQIDRASGQDVTWDGNPDCGIKVIANNLAANAANEGAVRALDVSSRNRGTNVSWVNAINAGARNDSGKTAYQAIGIQTRVENYGTLETEAIGIDVNMSIESDTGSPLKYGIRVRNTDASAMTAVDAAIHISHTSTNGFTHFAHLATNAGDGAVASVATPTGNTTEALIVKIGSNTRYIPVYAAVGFGG